jgi:hypothetical protein
MGPQSRPFSATAYFWTVSGVTSVAARVTAISSQPDRNFPTTTCHGLTG